MRASLVLLLSDSINVNKLSPLIISNLKKLPSFKVIWESRLHLALIWNGKYRKELVSLRRRWFSVFSVIAWVQYICYVIGREEYNIDHVVLSVWRLYYLNEKAHTHRKTTFNFYKGWNKYLSIKNKLTIISQKLFHIWLCS